jgi:hypothetical protein
VTTGGSRAICLPLVGMSLGGTRKCIHPEQLFTEGYWTMRSDRSGIFPLHIEAKLYAIEDDTLDAPLACIDHAILKGTLRDAIAADRQRRD